MSRLSSLGAAFGTVLSASLFGFVSEASACSLPAPGWYLRRVAGGMPANGVAVFNYICSSSCDTVPDAASFTMTTADGEVVPGEVVLYGENEHAHYAVFRPEPGALVAGQSYTVEIAGMEPISGLVAAAELTWSELSVTDEMSEVDQLAGEEVCCSGPLDTCGNPPCFNTMIERDTRVTLTWADETAPETLNQYAYRIVRDGAVDLPTPWAWNAGSAGFTLEETEDSTCFVLELQKLVDGSIIRFEQRCLERPATFTPGLQPTPRESVDAELTYCEGPPDGYLDEWCAVRVTRCTDDPSDAYCQSYHELCSDAGAGGAGGAGGGGGSAGGSASGGTAGSIAGSGGAASGGESGTGGADDGNAGETSEGGGERVLTKGCGCSMPGSGSNAPANLAFAALGLAVLTLRRRKPA